MVTTAPKPSFFHYFGPPMTEEEEAEEDENEDEDSPRIKLTQEEDYDIGTYSRARVWTVTFLLHC